MALKLYDKLTPSGDFPLVGAGDVELPGGARLESLLADAAVLTERDFSGFVLSDDLGYMTSVDLTVVGMAPLEAGRTYRVRWDGTEYTETAYSANVDAFGTFTAIGDGTMIGHPGSTAPFLIAVNAVGIAFYAGADSRESHRVGITLAEAVLSGSCLPAAKKPASIDLTNYAANGTIVETYADGSTFTHTVEFNADGKPVKVTGSDGSVTALTW